MKPIDMHILELKTVETQIAALGARKDELRKEIFGIVENEGLTDGYKNEYATVAYVERKSVKIADEKKLMDDLTAQKIVKYYEEIPEQIIPAHIELKPQLTKDFKDGKFTHPAVQVETATNLAIRFN
jgi:hypothetical protein